MVPEIHPPAPHRTEPWRCDQGVDGKSGWKRVGLSSGAITMGLGAVGVPYLFQGVCLISLPSRRIPPQDLECLELLFNQMLATLEDVVEG